MVICRLDKKFLGSFLHFAPEGTKRISTTAARSSKADISSV